MMPISGDPVMLGTADASFLLFNVVQLQELATFFNDGDVDFKAVYYKITHDVSLSSVEKLTPIGKTFTFSFKGTFDGNGKMIQNLTITGVVTGSGNYVGGLGEAMSGTATLKDNSPWKGMLVNNAPAIGAEDDPTVKVCP